MLCWLFLQIIFLLLPDYLYKFLKIELLDQKYISRLWYIFRKAKPTYSFTSNVCIDIYNPTVDGRRERTFYLGSSQVAPTITTN